MSKDMPTNGANCWAEHGKSSGVRHALIDNYNCNIEFGGQLSVSGEERRGEELVDSNIDAEEFLVKVGYLP